MASTKPLVHLLTAGTPNGHKISILLEELGIDYETTSISFDKKEQKTESFLAINPNGRIPAIEDNTTSPATPVFESGSIMLYITDKYDPEHKLNFAFGTPEYYEVLQWLFFLNAGVGPMQGQANHFYRYAPEKIQYGIDRYQNETRRLYGVLDKKLKETGDWLVGHQYTIADLANFTWVNFAFWAGVDTTEFPALSKWVEAIEARSATKKGLDVPTKFTLKQKFKDDPQSVENYAQQSSKWIMDGQKSDASKK
ncbi:protein of unknown function [Taphrina deformans PYCC 5710]|uniref:Glutathione S-transferase n=1 Tax=Taphrina deformans (strain PYCC 5710 / ATCC 11124 / CBS 356.35 / IMI 108563 / JCM 9778 / NBRC 8474) TaxID=1097556 RepID=R4XLQ6_TAPDE|nr:protein of unknown function [Taphrina deformans PYCC 5710]|eukprot:CCG84230.1 protein of unknown function [Taphrina deformans PYCC 5710]